MSLFSQACYGSAQDVHDDMLRHFAVSEHLVCDASCSTKKGRKLFYSDKPFSHKQISWLDQENSEDVVDYGIFLYRQQRQKERDLQRQYRAEQSFCILS